jgi:hypothetical protein
MVQSQDKLGHGNGNNSSSKSKMAADTSALNDKSKHVRLEEKSN